jgi:hypothetical protein
MSCLVDIGVLQYQRVISAPVPNDIAGTPGRWRHVARQEAKGYQMTPVWFGEYSMSAGYLVSQFV